ncbi:MAG: MFS transporter [Chloroflexi bacterium]|nr:MFS transporter [Chloroflexota bacterium]
MTEQANPRERYWRRNLIALCVAQIVTQIAFNFAEPFAPLFLLTMNVGGPAQAAQWAGLSNAASAFVMAFTQPLWGIVADRWGHRPMVVRAMVGGGLMVLLQGFSTGPEMFVGLRMLQGTVVGSVQAANALIATSAPRQRLGLALGIMQVALLTGQALGPLFGGFVADHFGYRFSYLASGVTLGFAGLLVLAFCREERPQQRPGIARTGTLAASRELLAVRAFYIAIVTIMLVDLGRSTVSPILSLYIASFSANANAADVGLVITAGGLTSAVAALATGHLSDRFGPRAVLLVCLAGSALTYVPQAYVHDFWHLLALRVALGGFLGGMAPAANSLIATLVPPERRGSAFGWTASASGFAQGIGPILGASVATGYGLASVFLVTGAFYAVAFVWALVGMRPRTAAVQPVPVSPTSQIQKRPQSNG